MVSLSPGAYKMEEMQHSNMYMDIQFTMETEDISLLPYIDTLTIKKSDGSLGYPVRGKPALMDLCLHADSYLHPQQNRARVLCDTENLSISDLQETFIYNGYNTTDLNRSMHPKYKTPTQRDRFSDSRTHYHSNRLN
jgi:hypothetical protein